MSLEQEVTKQLEKYRTDPEYQAEILILRVTEEIARLMASKNVNKAELARRLDVSKARVTHLLNGSPNLTIRTIASVATALGAETSVSFRDVDTTAGLPRLRSHREKSARPQNESGGAARHRVVRA